MTDILVIANGRLTEGSRAAMWHGAAARLREVFGGGADIYYTSECGDATRRARLALNEGVPWLAAAGGDGTIHEVVNAYFDGSRNLRPSTPLSFIPCGSGNDWVRTLGIDADPIRAVTALTRAHDRWVDAASAQYQNLLGSDEERVFLNIAEAGIGASVIKRQKQSARILRARPAFLLGALLEGFRYSRIRYRLVLDGEAEIVTEPSLALIVAGGRYFGAGMHCAPMAHPDDGLLEVILLGDIGKLDLVRNLRSFSRGEHLDHPRVRHYSVCRIDASAESEIFLQLDGEVVGRLPLRVSVLPRALMVRY